MREGEARALTCMLARHATGVQFDIKESSGPKLPPVRTKEEIDNIYVQKVCAPSPTTPPRPLCRPFPLRCACAQWRWQILACAQLLPALPSPAGCKCLCVCVCVCVCVCCLSVYRRYSRRMDENAKLYRCGIV